MFKVLAILGAGFAFGIVFCLFLGIIAAIINGIEWLWTWLGDMIEENHYPKVFLLLPGLVLTAFVVVCISAFVISISR